MVYTNQTGTDKITETSGEPVVSDRKAIDILKKAFPHLDLSQDPDISMSPGGSPGQLSWNISGNRPGRMSSRSEGFHARVDAKTGEILNLWYEGSGPAGGEIISREKALTIAEGLARKLQPDRFGSMRLQDSQHSDRLSYSPANTLNLTYSFYWERRANGMPVVDNGLGITVNALSGQVSSYSFNWKDNLELPPASAAISAKEASDKLMDEAGMQLAYYVPFSPNSPEGTPRASLVYRINSSNFVIDAQSGQVIDYLGRPLESARQFGSIPETSGEMTPPSPGSERISPVAALEKARRFFKEIGYPGEVEQQGSGSGSGPMGREEYWTFRPRNEEGRGGYALYPSVGIEVFSGRVSQFHSMEQLPGDPDRAGGKAITRDEAVITAKNFIQKVEPELYPYLVLGENSTSLGKTPYYSLRFARVVNGIVFPQEGISITIGQNGKITSYNCDWHRVEFPTAKPVITADQASATWLAESPLKMTYFFPRDNNGKTLPVRLVYQPQYGGIDCIDAVTGDPLGWDGSPVTGTGARGYDFTGSWAGQQLLLVAESGLLPPPDGFSPGSPASRRDGIRLLMAAAGLNYYDERQSGPAFSDVTAGDPDYAAIQRAVELEFIEKGGQFLPGEPLDRRTLAAWLVNGLRYREVASIPGLIESPFKDISELPLKDRNSIGLASGLGLLSGDGSGNFRPHDSVTWEELAAVAIKLSPRLGDRIGGY
ncbi:MAG: S-layer homology domain-containing protein [Actinobacteria bacterium]|nr:S-layer homology domain-containing protein [Actinomycetota bacterium]